MNKAKTTRPPSKRAKAVKPNSVEKAENLQPTDVTEDVKELPIKSQQYLANQLPSNKYAKKPKVGTPTLGREAGYVSEVGLGNLRTVTAYDNSDLST